MDPDEFERCRKAFLQEFKRCQPALSALGDETRQRILVALVESAGTGGLRVGDIQRACSASRTAVSHHLKVLKETRIVAMRREGTRNYYSLDSESEAVRHLARFWNQATAMMGLCEGQREERRL